MSKEEKLFRCIGNIEDTFINEAEDALPSSLQLKQENTRKYTWRRYGLVAASLLLLVVIGKGLAVLNTSDGKDASSGSASPSEIVGETSGDDMQREENYGFVADDKEEAPTTGNYGSANEEHSGGPEAVLSYESYAGPVLSLRLIGELDDVTASRNTVFDFSAIGESMDADYAVAITDCYTINNRNIKEQVYTVVYPFVYSPKGGADGIPELSADGIQMENTLSENRAAAQKEDEESEGFTSWYGYRNLLQSTALELGAADISTVREKKLLYQTAEITIPAGQSITVEASYLKAASYEYDEKNIGESSGGYAYDLVTCNESNLNITSQTADIRLPEAYEITSQNFGFNLELNIRNVELDVSKEHYYLAIEKRD